MRAEKVRFGVLVALTVGMVGFGLLSILLWLRERSAVTGFQAFVGAVQLGLVLMLWAQFVGARRRSRGDATGA